MQLGFAGLPDVSVKALAANEAGHIFAAMQGVGVFRSVDGGDSWVKLGKPLTSNDLPSSSVATMATNALGEPVVGLVSGAGPGMTSTVIARLDAASNSWVTATVSAQMNAGGYFPVGIRRDIDGALLSSWPFRADVMRSSDGGSSWDNPFPIPNASHVPPAGPSALVKAVYGVASQRLSGELFCGTEGDQWWRSTDRGASWSIVDAGGTSALSTEPGQNGFLVSFNRLGEPLFGTQGKPDGHFLLRLTADGKVVHTDGGFGPWAVVGSAVMSTVLRELVLTSEGDNFLAMPANESGTTLPCDLYGASDGATWQKLSAPFKPELNAIAAYGPSVLVGGGASTGVIWRYTPAITSHLPRVTIEQASAGAVSSGADGVVLTANALDPDGDTLSYSWKARGPGAVLFGEPSSPSTHVTFSAPGDYVVTALVSDGVREAGAPVIVRASF